MFSSFNMLTLKSIFYFFYWVPMHEMQSGLLNKLHHTAFFTKFTGVWTYGNIEATSTQTHKHIGTKKMVL